MSDDIRDINSEASDAVNDNEAIEAAAEAALEYEVYENGTGFLDSNRKETYKNYRFYAGFIKGVAWRDANPGPHVKALVEAVRAALKTVEKSNDQIIDSVLEGNEYYFDKWSLIEALEAYDKAVKGDG